MTDQDLLAVDFDKTLTDPAKGDVWRPAQQQEADDEMLDAVRGAYHDGKHIIVHTARKWNEAAQIAGWLTIHEVPYHGLRCEKGGADKYVDDKAETPDMFLGKEKTVPRNQPAD